LGIANAYLANSPLYVTGLEVHPGNRISLRIDGDNGVNIADCSGLSRNLEAALEQSGENFSLEVSSHGADTPLLLPRQFGRHAGRTLNVLTSEGEELTGVLTAVGPGEIVLEETLREPKPQGKGKRTVVRSHRIEYNQIKEARIKLKF
jgi:ribosome maturation factor RimP